VAQNHEIGIAVSGSDATVETTVVRGTLPRPFDGQFGRGIQAQLSCTLAGCDPATRANASVRTSVIEDNHEIGLGVGASDATVESTVVRRTAPRAADQRGGRGIDISMLCMASGCVPSARASATVRGSLIAQNHDIGLHVAVADADIETCVVRETLPQASDAAYGDGIAVLALGAEGPATAIVKRSRIEKSARAGVSSFGANVALGSSHLVCNLFDLEGEPSEGIPFAFDQLAPNACGCPEPNGSCNAVTTNLQAPEPLSGLD
jgi:hypothetical protein